ncbi:hypothetical protein TRFO_22243 [Tritrichomonas foetus]|uniref:Uncharacterized protein n=1 Tax=Tritrichomonas foetus TaxID=1144522 RepID=A0A1J4KCR0_9EUKA|nr:hypothetical protein TRFO_22243 [Tritrichomonas foetus]|eukprot:OHT09003.1 hypothetical protein TRFO_22243 [Tritrichomonas foetus]
MSESGSVASLPDLISDHLRLTRSITDKGFNQSSLHEVFRNQVDEILHSKEEIISLKAQLKMSQESIKLQEAEYAFQRKQYEDDIENLKKKEHDLIDTLTKFQNDVVQTHKYDVQVMLSQKEDEISKISNKYKKWKEKYHSLSSEFEKIKSTTDELQSTNKSLSEKLSNQTEEIEKLRQSSQISSSGIPEKHTADVDSSQIDSLSSQINSLKDRLTQSKTQSQNVIEDLNNQISKLTEENKVLKGQIESASAKIIKQQVRIGRLSDENKSISSSFAEYSNHIEQENQQLRAKAKQYRKQRTMCEDHLKQMQGIIQHVELERDAISDLLGIEADELNENWSKMTSKIEQLIHDASSINELRTQNDKLQKRLNVALEEARKPQSKTHIAGKDGYLATLQTNLKAARIELEQKNSILEKYKMRLAFNHAIELMNHNILHQINDLYHSLSSNSGVSMRPVILVVILAKRFFKVTKIEGQNDPTALQAFGEMSAVPLALKMETIRKSFTSLTQELMVLKQSFVECNETLQNAIEERDIAQLTLRSNSDEIKLTRKKMKYLKNRMQELQDELSSLVSPEMYNSVLSRLNLVEKHNTSLNDKIKELENELDQRTELEKKMNERVEQLQIKADQNSENAHQTRAQYAAKEEEIETLKSLLRDKTKEILSLERLVRRQEEKESTTSATFTCLTVENQELKKIHTNALNGSDISESTEDTDGMNDLKKAIKVEINPAFLGK